MYRVTVAAGREAKKHGLGNLGHASLEDAIAAGEAAKFEYYEQRLGAAVPRCLGLYKRLALAMEGAPPSLSAARVEELATAHLHGRNIDIDDFLEGSLHAGVLAPTGPSRGAYRIPIPSFERYLREYPAEPAPLPDNA